MFEENLKEIRKKRKLTQVELGQLSGLQSSVIAHYESGKRKPTISSLCKLATALSVTTDYLLGRTEENTNDILTKTFELLSDDDKLLAEELIKLLLKKR